MRRADVQINLVKHPTFQILKGAKLGSDYFVTFLVRGRKRTWK